MLGGVAAGIAKTYGWDVTLVRLAFVVAAIFGLGIPAYVVAWIVIPSDDGDGAPAEPRETSALVGLALLGIGVLWLGGRILPTELDFTGITWPLALIGGGIAVLVMRSGTGEPPTPAPPGAPESATGAPVGTAASSDVPVTDPTVAGTSTREHVTDELPTASASAWRQQARWGEWSLPPRPPRPRRPARARPRRFLGPLTVSVLLVVAGVAALLESLDAIDVDLVVVGAILLGIVGTALILSGWYGRARGLVALGVVLALLLVALSIVDTPFRGGIGERDHHPRTVRALEDDYELAIGHMELDMSDVPLRTGTTRVEASVAIGELVVRVPNDVTLDIHAEAGTGEVSVLENTDDGVSVEQDAHIRRGGARTLQLELRTGVGRVVVEGESFGSGQ